MPEGLITAGATPGLFFLMLAIAIAGIVRGFTGFGTALIFVPVAGIFLPPATVIGVMVITGVFSTGALIPRAWGQASRAEVGLLALAALITVPLGIWLLERLDGMTIRWIVAIVAALTLAALVSGWRFSGRVSRPGLAGIGGAAGVVGGLTGLTGPVVIYATLTIPEIIIVESFLSYLGLGIQEPQTSLGTLISTGAPVAEVTPWMLIYPGIILVSLLFCLTYVGDGLRDALDPKDR